MNKSPTLKICDVLIKIGKKNIKHVRLPLGKVSDFCVCVYDITKKKKDYFSLDCTKKKLQSEVIFDIFDQKLLLSVFLLST